MYQLNTIDILFTAIKEVANMDIGRDELEQKTKEWCDMIAMGYVGYSGSRDIVKGNVKRMQSLTEVLLTAFTKGFANAYDRIDEVYDKLNGIEKHLKTFPPYVRFEDGEESINFYSSLNKEEYTFKEVAEILKANKHKQKTRQWVSDAFTSHLFGNYQTKGKNKITKQGLYEYFKKWKGIKKTLN